MAVSADGRWAVSGSWDRSVKVWDLELGQEVRTFAGHSKSVTGVAVSASGWCATSVSLDQTVKSLGPELWQTHRQFRRGKSFVVLCGDARRANDSGWRHIRPDIFPAAGGNGKTTTFLNRSLTTWGRCYLRMAPDGLLCQLLQAIELSCIFSELGCRHDPSFATAQGFEKFD